MNLSVVTKIFILVCCSAHLGRFFLNFDNLQKQKFKTISFICCAEFLTITQLSPGSGKISTVYFIIKSKLIQKGCILVSLQIYLELVWPMTPPHTPLPSPDLEVSLTRCTSAWAYIAFISFPFPGQCLWLMVTWLGFPTFWHKWELWAKHTFEMYMIFTLSFDLLSIAIKWCQPYNLVHMCSYYYSLH